MFEMLSGRVPFETGEGGIWGVIANHLMKEPPRLTELDPSIPEEVEELVMKALAKDPAQRLTSEEFAVELAMVAGLELSGSGHFSLPLTGNFPVSFLNHKEDKERYQEEDERHKE